MAKKNKVPKVKKVKKPKNRLKRLGIMIIIGGIVFLSYTLFVKPNGFTAEQDVVGSFITNIEDAKACEDHFYHETTSICEVLQTEFEGKDVEFTSGRRVQGGMEIVLTVDEIELDFFVTFYDYEPSRLRAFFNDEYYLIDTIE